MKVDDAKLKIEEKCKDKNYECLGYFDKEHNECEWYGVYTYLKIKCNICGNEWFVTYNSFINMDTNCTKCAKKIHSQVASSYSKVKLTKEVILERILQTCKDNNISFLSFKNEDEKITIKSKFILKCNICNNEWETTYVNFYLKKHYCKQCNYKNRAEIKTLTTEEVIRRLKTVHPEYDYSETVYVRNDVPIVVICPKHGRFETTYTRLYSGYGCPTCGRERTISSNTYTIEEIQEMIKPIQNSLDEIDYSTYKNLKIETRFICSKHGEYWMPMGDYLHGHRCPKCKSSKLENEIRQLLTDKNIEFIEQYRCDWLGLQSLDFYLPKYNIAIECQGQQHFFPVDFGSKGDNYANERFEYTKQLDENKLKLCTEHGINIIYYSNLGIEYPYNVIENKEELLTEIYKCQN